MNIIEKQRNTNIWGSQTINYPTSKVDRVEPDLCYTNCFGIEPQRIASYSHQNIPYLSAARICLHQARKNMCRTHFRIIHFTCLQKHVLTFMYILMATLQFMDFQLVSMTKFILHQGSVPCIFGFLTGATNIIDTLIYSFFAFL